jgi:hypothetical protein
VAGDTNAQMDVFVRPGGRAEDPRERGLAGQQALGGWAFPHLTPI